MHKDVIIIGGGAAGLFCAFTAGQRGRSVLLIEHAEKPGKKEKAAEKPAKKANPAGEL